MFSGGKDSTAMLLKMHEKNMRIDEIIFCDTRLEFEEMYAHIEAIEKYINRKITRLQANKDFEYLLLKHELTKGKHKGCKGYGFPSMRVRWCTSALKTSSIKNYLKKYKDFQIIEYVGIAYDEQKRMKDKKYPLVEFMMTEKMALEYSRSKGFNWSGLYEKFNRVSCWCCPLQSISELKKLRKFYPKKWQQILEWESQLKDIRKKEGRVDNWMFRLDYSLAELDMIFEQEDRQIRLAFEELY